MDAIEHSAVNPNYTRYTRGALLFFRFVGMAMLTKPKLYNKLLLFFALGNLISLIIHFSIYMKNTNDDFTQVATAVNYITYEAMGVGKSLGMLYNRDLFSRSFALLERIYPSVHTEKRYELEGFLRIFQRVERFVISALWITDVYFAAAPLLSSLWTLSNGGPFVYRTPILLWHPMILNAPWYCFYYFLEICATFHISFTVMSSDLSLFSTVSQISMHLECLAKKIEEIDPSQPESVDALKSIIRKHQELLLLANDINDIFTPSLRFNLLTSSFIICFNGYQMLETNSIIAILKAFSLLAYEMKQVVFSCYYGQMLIDKSSRIFDAVYMHDWTSGSKDYKRLVLLIMLRSRDGCCLKIPGISNISLVTLKEVLSISYQAFTLLKTV